METVTVKVLHYYNYPILYPFMSQKIFEALEDAFLHDRDQADIPTDDYLDMISNYLKIMEN